MESTTEPRWKDNSFLWPTISWHILKHKFSVSKTFFKPTVWKHYILDLWDILKSGIVAFFQQAYFNIEFTVEISDTETGFLDTVTNVQKPKIQRKSYYWFWDALNLNKRKPFRAGTNSSKEKFEERSILNCKKPLMDRDNPHNLKDKVLSEI